MVKQIVLVIDKSGSMARSANEVVTGYNELLEEQKTEPGQMLITTVLFDTTAVSIHNCVDINDAAKLKLTDYVPFGSTALLDAVGDAVTAIRERNSSEGGLLVIITDGMENASKRYTYEGVKLLLNGIKESGWEIRYIGADLANFADAERMGIHSEQRMSIVKKNLSPTMKNISSGIKELRKGNPMMFAMHSTGKPSDSPLPYMRTAQGLALIDTGSPISFGDLDVVIMGRDSHPVAQRRLIDEIRLFLGMEVAAVIGMDILRRYDLRVTYISETSEYHVHHANIPQLSLAQNIPLRYAMGIPVVDAAVNGEVVPMFVDTGSHHTFIERAFIKGSKVGTVNDFCPGLGAFESPAYLTKLSLCGRTFTIHAAVLPRTLEHPLRHSGVRGIIGLDILKQQTTWLGFRSGMLSFEAAGVSGTLHSRHS